MSSFTPAPVLSTHHFEVSETDRGYWVAQDKEGLVGEVFRTRNDDLRFALFEAAGDSACVKVIRPRSCDSNLMLDSPRQSRTRELYGFFTTVRAVPARKLIG